MKIDLILSLIFTINLSTTTHILVFYLIALTYSISPYHITFVSTYLQLGARSDPRSITATSCRFLLSLLQCQPGDVGRPLRYWICYAEHVNQANIINERIFKESWCAHSMSHNNAYSKISNGHPPLKNGSGWAFGLGGGKLSLASRFHMVKAYTVSLLTYVLSCSTSPNPLVHTHIGCKRALAAFAYKMTHRCLLRESSN